MTRAEELVAQKRHVLAIKTANERGDVVAIPNVPGVRSYHKAAAELDVRVEAFDSSV